MNNSKNRAIVLNALIVIALVLCVASPEDSSLKKSSLVVATGLAIVNFANSVYPKKDE